MKCVVLISAVLSAVFGVLSTIFLIKGTAEVPADKRSFNGQSEREIDFRENARC